jgi:polygalacturonase
MALPSGQRVLSQRPDRNTHRVVTPTPSMVPKPKTPERCSVSRKGVALPGVAAVLSLRALIACTDAAEIAAYTYVCGTSEEAAFRFGGGPDSCGYDDVVSGKLPPEPTYPSEVCQTLVSDKSTPDESRLDTVRIQKALNDCAQSPSRTVKLVGDGPNNAFVASSLTINGSILWVDAGVTLYASRNADLYQDTGNCGRVGVNDSGACIPFINVTGTSPGIIGEGVIDGQGGEPLLGHDYSWWQLSGALRSTDGSIGNPTLIQLDSKTTGFVAYRITLHNSPKFHLKLASRPVGDVCNRIGDGFIVWGVTVLTPSRWYNSQGLLMTPFFSRNSDAIDPGANGPASCGVIACSTLSTGDDQIAIKGGNHVSDLIIAHNHFGTGHGMSIGSETYGGVENVEVYDLTIDADSRWTGATSDEGEGDVSGGENGIRIKSDISRGGLVKNINYHDICMRDVTNAIIVTPGYNPMFAGDNLPTYQDITLQNVHHTTCLAKQQATVGIRGLDAAHAAGPIALDNVIIDNIGPQAVVAEFADIRLGPGNVNFTPAGRGVTLTNGIAPGSTPRECKFAPLPVPERPEGWLW